MNLAQPVAQHCCFRLHGTAFANTTVELASAHMFCPPNTGSGHDQNRHIG